MGKWRNGMKLVEGIKISPFKYENVERPWGSYDLYADNVKCTTKILFVKKNEELSLQYHFKRHQFYYILDDNFIIHYSSIEVPKNLLNEIDDNIRTQKFKEFLKENLIEDRAREGDKFYFHSKVIHKATYVGNKEYGKILDIALGQENDELDIVRVEDKYGREDIKNIKI
jgi:mannose-6-phosphate isomerase-like protein (cupin superfamily)